MSESLYRKNMSKCFDSTDLEKYYSLVFTCSSCSKKYGSDATEEYEKSKNPKNLCPICYREKWFEGIEHKLLKKINHEKKKP